MSEVEIDNFDYITSNYIEPNFIKNWDVSSRAEKIIKKKEQIKKEKEEEQIKDKPKYKEEKQIKKEEVKEFKDNKQVKEEKLKTGWFHKISS